MEKTLVLTDLDLYRHGYVSIYITMTHGCNLRCPHCYDPKAPHNIPMSISQTRYLIGQVKSLGLPKYFYDLSGGELMTIPS